ncbi:MAG: PEP-CTERM sorting domain-containing protein [Cyanobacteria bacterium J055]|nr:MAG: PEP-CTERM sorting domain-containing protein [Cyanobacteria bacterium J055]
MTAIAKKLLIGASVIAGMSAANPAFAASITDTSLGGTAPSDVLLYCANGGFTEECDAPLANILQGNSSSPGGNVELAASSEKSGFDFSKYTSLTGKVDGRDITLSSLTASDWGGGFAQKWFGEALTANGFDSLFNSSQKTQLFNLFANYGGFQRFSDPNISYVNRDGSTGKVSIGLAGHYQASTLLTQSIDKYIASNQLSMSQMIMANTAKSVLATKNIFASEIVKVTYEGQTQLLYSFAPTRSGLVAKDDGLSHTGNYEVSLMGTADPQKEVPDPTTMVGGLMALSGMFAAKRKARKKA